MEKKIGILAQYLDSRHDIREFINALSATNQVVVFLRSQDMRLSNLLSDRVQVREIKGRPKKNLKNSFLSLFYKLFGILPVSEHNYYITEFFKLNHAHLSKFVRFKETFILHASKFTPKFISYDAYLKSIVFERQTQVDDIDEFLCFTQIYDDMLMAHVLETGKKVKVYVYSWDHPCKMKTFSKRVSEYLVWNEGLKEDLITLQFIEAGKIRVFGATQLTYIHDFLNADSKENYYSFPYIYFACATGYPKLVKQEVAIIEKTAQFLAATHPSVKLVVRTYPFYGADEHYAALNKHSNILVDDYKKRFDPKKDPFGVINDKLVKMRGAKGLVHLGTTFGLEASYFDAPVVLADVVKEHKELDEFVHQYQNDKYLNLKFKNIPQSWTAYKEALDAICLNDPVMKEYNKKVAATTALFSMKDLAQTLYSMAIEVNYNPTNIFDRVFYKIRRVIRDLQMGICAAKSFLLANEEVFRFIFHEDGSLTAEDIALLNTHFPGSRIITRAQADKELKAVYGHYPALFDLRDDYPIAIKLIDVSYYAEKERIVFFDPDILFFDKTTELLNTVKNSFNRDIETCYFASIGQMKKAWGIEVLPRINSGLWQISRKILNIDQLNSIVASEAFSQLYLGRKYVREQTIMALLVSANPSETNFLSPTYDVDYFKAVDQSVCKHYVGKIRHGFELEGLRYLLDQKQFEKRWTAFVNKINT